MPKYLVTLHLDSWAGMREPSVKQIRVTRPTLEAATARGNYLREETEAVGVIVTPIETEEAHKGLDELTALHQKLGMYNDQEEA